MCWSFWERKQAPLRGKLHTLRVAGWLEMRCLYHFHTPRGLLHVVYLTFEGQEARRRRIHRGRFDRLPVVIFQAMSLDMMTHGGAAEIVSQFPFTRRWLGAHGKSTTLIPLCFISFGPLGPDTLSANYI